MAMPNKMQENEADFEITKEMVAAGALAVVQYNDDYESAEDAAIRIFRAMLEARASSSTDAPTP